MAHHSRPAAIRTLTQRKYNSFIPSSLFLRRAARDRGSCSRRARASASPTSCLPLCALCVTASFKCTVPPKWGCRYQAAERPKGRPTAHSLRLRMFPPRTSACNARIDPRPGSAAGGVTLEGEGVSWPSRICTGREHASVRVPTGDHRTNATCACNLDSVTEGLQLGAGALGDTWLHAQHAGLVGMRPE